MMTMVVLIERPLTDHDVQRIAHFNDPDGMTVHLVAASEPEGGAVSRALDEVATLGAFEATVDPDRALTQSIAALHDAGVEVDGELSGADVPASVRDASVTVAADQIWVVTPVHFIEDGLHLGWADELRRTVDIPVLHVESGTDRVLG